VHTALNSNQPVVLRKTGPVAIVRLLQVVLPAAIVGGSLMAIVRIQDVEFDQFFIALCALAMALSLLMLQPRQNENPELQLDPVGMGIDLAVRWITLLFLLLALGYVTHFSDQFARRVVIPWALVTPVLVYFTLLFLRMLMRRAVLSQENLRTAVVVGVNQPSITLVERLTRHPELCTRVEGFFDDRSAERLNAPGELKVLGKLNDLVGFVRTHSIDVIFIALPIRHIQRVMDLLDELHDSTASLYFVPDVFVFDLIQSRTHEVMGVPVVALCETPFFGYRGVMKRLTDMGFTLAIMTVALPVMVIIAALVKLTSPGPVIFRQRRYGLDGKDIVVYKFRTMYVTEDGQNVPQATRNDARITPIGRLLRKYSLDELPQLINVLQGRMSLVGPRPHAVAHNEQYRRLIKGYMIRHKVLPGITGWAQVNGCRGETSELSQMEQRVHYDLDYLRRWSPSLDFRILIMTALRMLFDKQAY
jgi:putative colanic acid biosynthesis UDP-glucose lipid carrier transferase